MEFAKKTYHANHTKLRLILDETQYMDCHYNAVDRSVKLSFSNDRNKEEWLVNFSEQEAMRIKNELEAAIKGIPKTLGLT